MNPLSKIKMLLLLGIFLAQISIAQENTQNKTQSTPQTKPIQKTSDKPKKLAENAAYNGTTFIAKTTKANPQPLKLDKKTFYWLPHPKDSKTKIAIIPINYYTKAQNANLGEGVSLEIVDGNYKKETITITNTEKVKPNPKNQERIKRERDEANQIYSRYDSKRYWTLPFVMPMESKITSQYGTARMFNGEIKSYHGGTDFRAAIGTPIYASNDGVVVIAKDRFLAGGSVVISHGEGIFSMYYHCSELKVKVGDKVKKGDLVALSGASGRVSGPHLHFGFFVNGTQVDPLDFIAKMNALDN